MFDHDTNELYKKLMSLMDDEQKADMYNQTQLVLFASIFCLVSVIVWIINSTYLTAILLTALGFLFVVRKMLVEKLIYLAFGLGKILVEGSSKSSTEKIFGFKSFLLDFHEDLKQPPNLATLALFLAFSLFACGFIFSFRGL